MQNLKTTETAIKEVIKAEYKREETSIILFENVRAALLPFENKPITKRLATAVQKYLGETYHVYYNAEHGMFHIAVWKDNYDERLRFLIGYQSQDQVFHIGKPDIEHSGFEYYSRCYGQAAKERNKDRFMWLQSPEKIRALAIAIIHYKDALEALKEFDSLNTPDLYAIRRALEFDI